MLAHAARHACDMIVVGCHGRGRLRERLFGGASREVLEAAALPLWRVHRVRRPPAGPTHVR
ncbi:MAG: universal stress protein [Proteobacteria bacterium]|nr:universal stress protein [Pseudomonadota bacterium]